MGHIAYSLLDRLERTSKNEDPLGFFTYATRLADQWLPGITTRTRRARYYSMVCGGLLLIEDEFKDELRRAEQRDEEITRLFMRWERLWATWNGAIEADAPGMIGRNKVSPLFKENTFQPRTLDYSFIQRQPDLGALGSYRSSLEATRLLREDCLDLTTPDGKRLGAMFWDAGGNRRAWNATVEGLRTGRITLSPARNRLAEYGNRFGLNLRGPTFQDERLFLRRRLFPEDLQRNRRLVVLKHICDRGWAELDESTILKRTAHVNHGSAWHDTFLQHCAAAIITLEGFRTQTMRLLNAFKETVLARGSARPESTPAHLLRTIAPDVNQAHKRILRFVRSPDFQETFRDFPMPASMQGIEGLEWLKELLRIHREEMARRRTPRWFIQVGGGRWMLHESIAAPSDQEAPIQPYSYRTGNLLTLARETGYRL